MHIEVHRFYSGYTIYMSGMYVATQGMLVGLNNWLGPTIVEPSLLYIQTVFLQLTHSGS